MLCFGIVSLISQQKGSVRRFSQLLVQLILRAISLITLSLWRAQNLKKNTNTAVITNVRFKESFCFCSSETQLNLGLQRTDALGISTCAAVVVCYVFHVIAGVIAGGKYTVQITVDLARAVCTSMTQTVGISDC